MWVNATKRFPIVMFALVFNSHPCIMFVSKVGTTDGSTLGNCDINFLVFCHRFLITSLKFLKFKRVQNSVVKFLNSAKAKPRKYESWQSGTKLLFTID